MTTFTDKGIPAPKDYFTGTVWVNMNVKPNEGYNINMGTISFEKQARTNWHSHTSGQILFVIEGIGYYQELGKPIQLIQKGDVVKIPKNSCHWHGASHNSTMRHIALVPEFDKDTTDWLQAVSEEEYNTFKAPVYEVENKLTPISIMNHEELWANYISKIKETNLDLIEIFDNFAFDETINYHTMDVKTRVLMVLASTIGNHTLTEYSLHVNAALNVGISPIEIKEVLHQSVPFVGISKVIDFINTTNEIFIERNISLPLGNQSTTPPETDWIKDWPNKNKFLETQ